MRSEPKAEIDVPADGAVRVRIAFSVLFLAALLACGLLAISVLNSDGSTAQANPYNSFSTGNVTLADNATAGTIFTIKGAEAGATGSACVALQYTGTLGAGSDVSLYAGDVQSTNSLASDVTLSAQDGTDSASFATGDPDCSDFKPNSDTTLASPSVAGSTIAALRLDRWPTSDSSAYALANTGDGAGSMAWVTNPTTVWYRFTYAIASNAPSDSSAAIQLEWEADGQ